MVSFFKESGQSVMVTSLALNRGKFDLMCGVRLMFERQSLCADTGARTPIGASGNWVSS